jgi:hypothetical protein
MRRSLRLRNVVLLFALLATVIASLIWLKRFLAVDSCLDRGGRWNYELSTCEGITELP